MSGMTARQVIETLGLERHPEGGWYRQTYRDEVPGGCTVAPGFEFAHFELAPPGWQPG